MIEVIVEELSEEEKKQTIEEIEKILILIAKEQIEKRA